MTKDRPNMLSSKLYRALSLILIVGMLASSISCAELQKKFIRKKKEKKVKPIFYQEPIRKKNMELYREHYLYWQGWHKELIFDLGGNRKKELQDMYEARRHLAVLPNYLEPEYAQKLEVHIKDFDRYTASLKRHKLSEMEISQTRRRLDRLRLRVEKHFSLSDVELFLLPDPPPIDLSDYEDEDDFFPEFAPDKEKESEDEFVETQPLTETETKRMQKEEEAGVSDEPVEAGTTEDTPEETETVAQKDVDQAIFR